MPPSAISRTRPRRSPSSAATLALHEAGVGFISQKDGFDLTTPMGRLMFQMLGAFAEFERNIIAERIRAGLRTAKLKGHKPGPKIGRKSPSRVTLWRMSRDAGNQGCRKL